MTLIFSLGAKILRHDPLSEELSLNELVLPQIVSWKYNLQRYIDMCEIFPRPQLASYVKAHPKPAVLHLIQPKQTCLTNQSGSRAPAHTARAAVNGT